MQDLHFCVGFSVQGAAAHARLVTRFSQRLMSAHTNTHVFDMSLILCAIANLQAELPVFATCLCTSSVVKTTYFIEGKSGGKNRYLVTISPL